MSGPRERSPALQWRRASARLVVSLCGLFVVAVVSVSVLRSPRRALETASHDPLDQLGALTAGLVLSAYTPLEEPPSVTPRPTRRTPPVKPTGPARGLERPIATVRETTKTAAALAAPVTEKVAPVAAAVSVGSAVVTTTTAAAAAPGGLLGLLQAVVPLFGGASRRRRPLGRVVEEGTGQPLPGTLILLLDEQGKPREHLRSRPDGTFALVAPAGKYHIVIQQEGYELSTHPTDVLLFPGERLYAGGTFEVTREAEPPPLVIVLRPTGKTRPRPSIGLYLRRLFDRARILQAHLALPILLIGASVNSLALIVRPSLLLVVFELLYGVLFIIEFHVSRSFRRAIGIIRDAVKKAPVPLAIIRLTDAETQRLVATRMSSPQGTFLMAPPPGRYTLHTLHAAYHPHKKEDLRIRKGSWGTVRVRVDLQPRKDVPRTPEPPRTEGGTRS